MEKTSLGMLSLLVPAGRCWTLCKENFISILEVAFSAHLCYYAKNAVVGEHVPRKSRPARSASIQGLAKLDATKKYMSKLKQSSHGRKKGIDKADQHRCPPMKYVINLEKEEAAQAYMIERYASIHSDTA